jgi:hypothetical protein
LVALKGLSSEAEAALQVLHIVILPGHREDREIDPIAAAQEGIR